MNTKTLTALQGSIQKWERIVKGTGIDMGKKDCPLCVLFYCNGCLIEKKGYYHCLGTPYQKWYDHHIIEHNTYSKLDIECSTCRKLAKAELKFLKSLLPKRKKL